MLSGCYYYHCSPPKKSQDVQLMRHRSHVLHKLLEGFVLRRGHEILHGALPPKFEHVIFLRPSTIQGILYDHVIDQIKNGPGMSSAGPLKAFALCSKVGKIGKRWRFVAGFYRRPWDPPSSLPPECICVH